MLGPIMKKIRFGFTGGRKRLLCLLISVVFVFTSVFPPVWSETDSVASPLPVGESSFSQQPDLQQSDSQQSDLQKSEEEGPPGAPLPDERERTLLSTPEPEPLGDGESGYAVTNLEAAPNDENDAIVLTWVNPPDRFGYAEIYRWRDGGEGSGWWSWIGSTEENSYTDMDVGPYRAYRYQVIAVDDDWSEEQVPVEVEGALAVTAPILFSGWDAGNDGRVNGDYVAAYYIGARVMAAEDIVSIEYEISEDETSWAPVPEAIINYEWELYYNNWSGEWARELELDLSGYEEGPLWIRATAEDGEGHTASEIFALSIDLACEAAADCRAVPNEENTALVLSWSAPEDCDYARIYKEYYSYGWRWGFEASVEGASYTDNAVDPTNPYATYRYKIILYDKHGNESPESPVFTGSLEAPGPIGLKAFETDTKDGRINRYASSYYYLSASFYCAKPLTEIRYEYSLDGEIWSDLKPFLSEDQKLQREERYFYSYRFVRMNIGPDSGIPDGPVFVRATAVDGDGNTLSAQADLVKDATPPQGVTNITAVPNEDNTAMILSWKNPTEDFAYLIIDRDGTTLTPEDFNQETFTDTTLKAGIKYPYRFDVYDAFGNLSDSRPVIEAVLSTSAPVLETMFPAEGYVTNGNTVGYDATFRSNTTISLITFEASRDGGVTWITLKEGTPAKEYFGYRLSGSWDVSGIGEEDWLIRATATDAAGGSASETRAVRVDHVAPPAPENFRGEITSLSPNRIAFQWDPVPGAKEYILYKKYANPKDGSYPSSSSTTATSYELDYGISTEVPYLFTVQALDLAGNYGAEASLAMEIYSGPDIALEGGHNVYTNQSLYTLRGAVSPADSSITVNETPVDVDGEGRFSYETTLTLGINDFTIRAEKDGQAHETGQRATYDTTPPTISESSPYDKALVRGTQTRIYLRASDNSGSLGRKVLQITVGGEDNWRDVIEIPPNKTEVYWDTTASIEGIGVLADGAYKFRFSVRDSAGNSRDSAVMVWTLDNTKPEPPGDLTAAADIGKITLNWPASVSGDLRSSSPYTVYRSLRPAGGYTSLITTSNTNYTDATAEEGKTYYYVVTATDQAGNESLYSKEAAGQITADTTPPVFSSVPANGSIYGKTYPYADGTGTSFRQTLSATDNSPKGIKQFKVEYSNDGGATWKASISGPSSGTGTGPYSVTFYISTAGMTDGPYLFRYSATDHAGNTVSAERNATMDLTAYPVRNLSARSGEASSILEWDLPETSEPSVYRIWRSTYYSGGYNRIGDALASTAQSYTDSGVSIGTTYYYKVVTLDNYGNTASSAVASTTPSDDLTPPEITGVSKEDGARVGGKVISISVDARDNKEPAGIDFSGSQDGGTTWKPLSVTFTGRYSKPDNIYAFSYNWNPAGLSSGAIQVRMTARDAAGNSSPVVTRTWTLDLTVTAPSNLRATGGDGSILIQWDGISDTDVGEYVYTVARAEKSGGPYTVLNSLLPKTVTSYTDSSAATGVTYYYVVRSRDNLGNEAQSAELAATPAGDEIPPVIVRVDPAAGAAMGGEDRRELRVYATDNGGRMGTTASFEYSADGGTSWLPVNTSYDGPVNYDGTEFYFRCYWDLKELTSGEYKVRYTVSDSSGNSASQIADYAVDRTPPSAPENLIANYGSLNIGLGWEIPAEADVTGYRVYRSNSIHDSYVKIGDVTGKENNSFVDSTVVSGVLYYYKVTAVDAFGQEGEFSNVASAKAEADHIPPEVLLMKPDYYTVIGAVARITVTAEDNSALSSISLEYYNGDTESWIPINTIATLDKAVFNWSTVGLSGEVKVRAIAKDSAGNFSSPEDGKAIRIYIIDNEGPAVTGLRGTSFGGDIVLEWNNVTDKDFAYFLVEKQDVHGTYHEVKKVYNVLGLNVTGLTPNTDYRFRVTAFDKAGNSGTPAEITVNSGGDTARPVVEFQAQWYQIYSGNESILVDAFEARDNVGVKKIIAQYSADDGATWVNIGERILDTPVAKLRTGELWNVRDLPDGVYDVRLIAEDEAGNVSLPSEPAYYFVDHQKPEAPADLELSSTAGYVNVSWKYKAEDDFWYFRLWRAEAEDGLYEPLPLGKYQYLRYLDRSAENGKTYYYKVTVVDRAGNESEYSDVISGGLSPDTNPPYLYLYDPTDGDVLNSKTRFSISIWDDLALKRLTVRYRAAGTEGEWGTVFTKDYDPDGTAPVTYREEAFFWDTKDIPEGRYDIHYIVEDKAGNATDSLVITHLLNNVPPEAPVLSGQPGGWSASLSWTCGPEPEDFSRYAVYRSDMLGGNFQNIGAGEGGTGAEKAFTDRDVRPGIRYYYYVRAYDVYGNYSQSDTINLVPTSEDLIAPVARAGDDLVLTTGLEGSFDGTLSSDNDRIASYSWNFGDGGTSSAAQPAHSYSAPGSYTATLTVKDPAGNESSDSVSVTVVSAETVGILEVRVINDATGELLPGASVVIDYPDGASLKVTTNTVGTAFVVAPPGSYQVYAFKTDFKPASQKVTMVRGTRDTIMIRLPKGPVVTGELKAERMTLEQIIAAGIDINDPENRQAYQFEIGLGFMDQPVIVTKNRFLPPPMAPSNFTINEDGTRIFIFEAEREDGTGGRIFIGEKLDLGGGGPAMAYMIIPGKTAWLKEFFDISFSIQNGADPEYIIEGAYARLTLPDGLSLAPTREGQHLYVEMGDIPGGGTGFANWIVRGDKKGEYRLEAEFNGTIMPFGDVIRQRFRNEEPIRIWGENAVKMHVKIQDRADKGHPYNLRIEIENTSDAPLYHIDFELLEESKVNYIYAPNQKLSETIEELAPGASILRDFQLIPALDGDLDPRRCFALRTGGEAEVETDTTSVSAPENAAGTAPVLTQVNNADGTVDLSWDSVEVATGYKIYRIRQDLNMSAEPGDLVYTCGPEVLAVNLDEGEGARDYVIKTVTGEGERMRHAVTGFSWVDYIGAAALTVYPEVLIANRTQEMRFTARKGGVALENGRLEIEELNVFAGFKDGFGQPVYQVTQTVTPEKEGPVTVRLYDGGELLLEKIIQVVLPDPPAQPRGLSGTAADRGASLTWFPNSEPELVGYYLYQIRSNGWVKVSSALIRDARYEVSGLIDDTVYTFQVSAVDRYGRESAPSEPFQIGIGIPEDRIAPWVTGTLPVSRAENVSVNTEIKFFFSENVALWEDEEEIRITAGGVPVAYDAAETAGSTLTVTLAEPLPMKSHCVVILPAGWVRDRNFNVLAEEYKLEFFTGAEADTIAPVLTGVSPQQNASEVPVDSAVVLHFSETVAAGAAYEAIAVTANGSPVPFTSAIDRNKVILTPEALPYDAAIRVTVPAGAVADGAGNPLARAYEVFFYTVKTLDTRAPRVVSMMPSANSREVPLNAEINIYFSEKVAAGGSFDAIALKTGGAGTGGSAVEAAVAVNGNALTIRPATGLAAGSLYRVSVPAASVQDLAGNGLAALYEASFLTGQTVDNSAPAILSTYPDQGAENVSGDSEIRIGFGEDIQPGGNFDGIMLLASGSMVNFETEISGGELVLIPEGKLPAGADMQVMIPADALKDVAGNGLDSQESLSFLISLEEEPLEEVLPAMMEPLTFRALDSKYRIPWQARFGGAGSDQAYSVIEVPGGFVFTGTVTDSEGLEYTFLLKTDETGNVIWEKSYGGGFRSAGREVAQTRDGGYIIAGTSKLYFGSYEKVYLVKTDGEGNLEWEKKLDLEAQGYLNSKRQGFSVKEAPGGYIIAGMLLRGDTSDALLIKTNNLGIVSWAQVFGGAQWDWFYDVEVAEDGFIAGGFTEKDFKYYEYLVKVDDYGGTSWEYTGSAPGAQIKDLLAASDGNIIASGYRNAKISLTKTSGDGVSYWGKSYDDGIGYGLAELENGDFVIAGNGKILGVKADGTKGWDYDLREDVLSGDNSYVSDVVVSSSGHMVFAGYGNFGVGQDAWIFELGSDRASLGVSTPNVLKDGSIYLFAPLYLDDGRPDTTATAEVEVKVRQGDGEPEVIPLSDGNFFPSDDYTSHDGVYSGIYVTKGTDDVIIDLFVDGIKEDTKTVSVINDPQLVVLTHLKALYDEFLDTGSEAAADENRNDIPDYFDLLDRMALYAEAYNGIVVDVNEEITKEKEWTQNYSDYNYDDGDAQYMAESVDKLMDLIFGYSGTKLKSVAIIGDDEVLPFYRKSDTLFQDDPTSVNERKYVPEDMKGEDWGNPTLCDTSYESPSKVMSDVPYGTWVNVKPDDDLFPLPRAGVGRIFADKPSTLTDMIDGFEKPINLITGQGSAAVFNLDSDLIDKPTGVNFPATVERAVTSVLDTKFKKAEGWTSADYKKGEYYQHDGTVRDWGGSDVVEGVEKADISVIWSHADHLRENTQKNPDMTYNTFRSIKDSPGHMLINAGCHSGYTVSHNNSMNKSKSFLPYDQAMVKQVIGKQVAYIAPTTYGYGSDSKPTDHDLLTKTFLQALLDGTPGTVGDKWTKAYGDYRTEYNNTYDAYSVYSIYGMCYYGLPTQPVASSAAELRARKTLAESDDERGDLGSLDGLDAAAAPDMEGTLDSLERRSMESHSMNITLNIPEPILTFDREGSVLIEIPGGSGSTMTRFAPILPLMKKTYILPAGSEVESVSLKSSAERAVLGPLELQTLRPVNKTFGPAEGSFEMSGLYPEKRFTWLQEEREGGVYLTLSAAPVQYDPASKKATVWSGMEFEVAYTVPERDRSIRSAVVNGGSPVKIGDSSVPASVEIDSDGGGEAVLQWQIRDFSGLIIASGRQEMELTAGENTQEFTFDTRGWSPGDKGLTIMVLKGASAVSRGVVVASWFEDIPVSGLYAALEMEKRSYEPSDASVSFAAEIRDENGSPVAGLSVEGFEINLDGKGLAHVALDEENAGNYKFSFPVGTLTEGIHSLALICQVAGSRSAPVSKEFAVAEDVEGPDVIRTDPAPYEAGVALNSGIVITFDEILFEGAGFEGIQLLKITKAGDVPGEIAKTIQGAVLTITPASSLEPNSVYKVVLPSKAVQDVKGNEFLYPYSFRFITYAEPDGEGPAVIATIPRNEESDFPSDSAVKLQFDESVGAGANATAVSWTADGEPVVFNVTYYANELILSPKAPVPFGALCQVTVPAGAVNDLWGNALEEGCTFTFTMEAAADSQAPLILYTVPEDGMEGVLTDALITVRFGEIVLPGNHYGEIALTDGDGGALSYTAELQRDTLTLTPEENLGIDQEYRVEIPTGAVKDLTGNLLEEAREIRFTTGGDADTAAPKVEETVPGNGAQGVLTDTPIYIYFNEAIQKGDLFERIDFLDLSEGGEGESIGFTSFIGGRALILTPSAGLAHSTGYRVAIPAGAVKDLTGNVSEGDTRFDFRTEDAPDTQPPQLTATSPEGSAAEVSVYAQIRFVFDESIRAGSEFSGISVTGKDGPVPFAASIEESDLILTPTGAMPLGTAVTVSVPAGAVSDLFGNQLSVDLALHFTTGDETVVDTKPPVTIHSISGTAGAEDWYTSKVQVTLTAVDDISGIADTSFSIGGEIWNDYVKPFTVDREGEVTVYYRSADRAGNVEAVKSFTVKIDTVAPAVSSSVPANGATGVSKGQSLRVTFSEDIAAGETYGSVTLSGGGSPVTMAKSIEGKVLTLVPASLDYGTTYTLTIPAGAVADAVGNPQKAGYVMSFTTGSKPQEGPGGGGGGGGAGGGEVLPPEKLDVTGSIDDRKHPFVSAGEAEAGSGIISIRIDGDLLSEGLKDGGNAPRVAISVGSGADLLFTGLTGQTVRNMEERGAVLEITTGLAGYTIPAELMNIDEIARQFGNPALGDIAIDIRVTRPSPDMVKIMEDAAVDGGLSILVPPVEFTIACTYNGRTIEVENFSMPVGRTVPIPAGVDPKKITTAVVVEKDGVLRHVPTKVVEIGGVYYAKITSLTNSVYTLIWNQVEFKDMGGHWAKESVNDFGSRLIISGAGDGNFKPDSMITRAELAAVITRALGSKSKAGGHGITDISEGDWFYGAVNGAVEYGIITGYEDGSFRPDQKVTREESFSMIARAMELVRAEMGASAGLTEAEAEDILDRFTDSKELGSWSRKMIAYAVQNGIVSGYDGRLTPGNSITRAEAASIVARMLQNADLINR